MPGAQAHPQPCVRKVKAHKLKSPQVRRNIPAFPARWFYGFLRALSGDRAWLSPSQATMDEHRSQLDSSVEESKPHDFAVRDRRLRLMRRSRPPHPAPNVRDDRETPLFVSTGQPTLYCCFYPIKKRNIFCFGTGQERKSARRRGEPSFYPCGNREIGNKLMIIRDLARSVLRCVPIRWVPLGGR